MAAHTCAVAQTATLSSTTADSVAFTGYGSTLAITNHNSSTTLYFRFDGTTAVAEADNNYPVLPLQTALVSGTRFGGSMSLSVVGNGNKYTAWIF